MVVYLTRDGDREKAIVTCSKCNEQITGELLSAAILLRCDVTWPKMQLE